MAFVYEFEADEYGVVPDIPTTLRRSKADCPKVTGQIQIRKGLTARGHLGLRRAWGISAAAAVACCGRQGGAWGRRVVTWEAGGVVAGHEARMDFCKLCNVCVCWSWDVGELGA